MSVNNTHPTFETLEVVTVGKNTKHSAEDGEVGLEKLRSEKLESMSPIHAKPGHNRPHRGTTIPAQISCLHLPKENKSNMHKSFQKSSHVT